MSNITKFNESIGKILMVLSNDNIDYSTKQQALTCIIDIIDAFNMTQSDHNDKLNALKENQKTTDCSQIDELQREIVTLVVQLEAAEKHIEVIESQNASLAEGLSDNIEFRDNTKYLADMKKIQEMIALKFEYYKN